MWAVDAQQLVPGTPAVRWTPRRLLPASDEGLARMVAAGNEEAFAALYDRYHQRLYRYCRSMLGKDEDAQDALQSTFAGAYAALAQGRRDAPMRPWLYRIAHNEAVSVMRRRRPEMEIAEDRVPPAASAAEVAHERGRLALLMADLAALTERQRAALVMRELSGLSHAEIATALTIDESGAKQTIFEARRSLHEFAEGRAMVCEEVCRAVSTGGGRTLRSRKVRAHLRDCQGCQAFADAIPARTKSLHALSPPLAGAAATSIMRRALAAGAGHGGGGGAGVAVGTAGKTASAMALGKALAGAAAVATVAAGATGIVRLAAPASAHRSGVVHHRSQRATRGRPVSIAAGGPAQTVVHAGRSVAAGVVGRPASAAPGHGRPAGAGPRHGRLTAGRSQFSARASGRGHARSANTSSSGRALGRAARHGQGGHAATGSHGASRAAHPLRTPGVIRPAAHLARTSAGRAAQPARTSTARAGRFRLVHAAGHRSSTASQARAVIEPALSSPRATGKKG
jgi:RNA polymerase sigma factor (sigma-70 family)